MKIGRVVPKYNSLKLQDDYLLKIVILLIAQEKAYFEEMDLLFKEIWQDFIKVGLHPIKE